MITVRKIHIRQKNIVIATGSSPLSLPGIDINEKNIISSTAALSLNSVPKSLVIIGGRYIGLEDGFSVEKIGF